MKFAMPRLHAPKRPRPRVQHGQSSMEYVIVCAAMAMALGIGMSGDDSVLKELLQAFRTAYEKIAFSLSLPG